MKMKMKYEEEKNQILPLLCYNCYFFRRKFWILLARHRFEKSFQKYYFSQKIQAKVWAWLASKKAIFCWSISAKLFTISFDWNNIFERFFHSDDVLRLKNHPCENGNYIAILQGVYFFLFHFSSSFSKFFKILLIDNIPLTIIFTTSIKSLSNFLSYKHLKFYCQLIWNRL